MSLFLVNAPPGMEGFLFSAIFQSMGATAMLWACAAFVDAAWKAHKSKVHAPYLKRLLYSGSVACFAFAIATLSFSWNVWVAPETVGDPSQWQYQLSRGLMVTAGVISSGFREGFWSACFWTSLFLVPLLAYTLT